MCGGVEAYCNDRIDNDGDGYLDCDDDDCATNYNCMGMDYGIPYETSCRNCVDDDDDGDIDCDDSDCSEDVACVQMVRYGIPM